MNRFAESSQNLRDALASLTSAYRDALAAAADDPTKKDLANNLRWMISDIKRVIRDQWLDAQVFSVAAESCPQAFTEAGAKFSKETLEALSTIQSHLASLLGTADSDEDKEFQKEAVAEAITCFEGATASLAAILSQINITAPTAATLTPISEALRSAIITPTILAEGSDPANHRYRMLVIEAGRSKNKVNYSEAVLAASVPLLEGKSMYIDHPFQNNPGNRSLATKVGWWSDVTYQEGIVTPRGKVNGIVATSNLLAPENSPAPWFPGMVAQALDAGKADIVGISILAHGKMRLARDAATGEIYKEAVEIEGYVSADAVAEPGAGGQPITYAANSGVDADVMNWTTLTAEGVANLTFDQCVEGMRVRPDLVEAFSARLANLRESGEGGDGGGEGSSTPPVATEPAPVATPDPAPATPPAAPAAPSTPVAESAPNPAQAAQFAEMTTMYEAMRRQTAESHLRAVLAEARLPEGVVAEITGEIGTQILESAQIDNIVAKYKRIHAASQSELASRMVEGVGSQGVIIPPRQYGATDQQITTVEQISLALDDFFGAPIEESKKGKYPLITSFTEFYKQVTGDSRIDGEYDPRRAALGDVFEQQTFGEALPGATHVVGGGTITMQNLLGTSMNRALFNFYKAQPRWWEPIVSKRRLTNLKQQDRIRLHNFGSLTNRTQPGAEYTELDWAETAESYTPTTFGNIVTVTREAIINDDLDGISNIPRLLGQSAIITINEYMSALFTANSGNGPNLADGQNVFNFANHQGNRMTLALTRQNLVDARKIIMKMNNDAGKRIGLMAKYLLVPIDLEDVGFELTRSVGTPGSANNEPNILADNAQGLRGHIVVPNWTDANNWYVMADPEQLTSIELGFLYGREEPEFFQQNRPDTGMVFTNDVLSWKIRWDFGADWLDYRGAVGSIVA